MKINDLKIGTQLKIGFGIILLLIAITGALSWMQNNQLALQTKNMYNHPLKVRRALGVIESNVLNISRNMKEMFLVNSELERSDTYHEIEKSRDLVSKQLSILYDAYLGPHSDIDNLKDLFLQYNILHDATYQLIRDGKIDIAKERTNSGSGITGILVERVLEKITIIDEYAIAKSDQFYSDSVSIQKGQNTTNLIFIFSSLFLASIIIALLTRNILRPLAIITDATKSLKDGDLSVRSNYNSKNEFGHLSDGYNEMADKIEEIMSLNNNSAHLAEIMLSEDIADKFSLKVVSSLMQLCNAQIGAMYLISDDKTTYNHFSCIGIDKEACKPVSAKMHQGEFGISLATKKISHITNIPDDTQFKFSTVSGTFKPREIITIPIVSENEIEAIISLVTIKSFTESSLKLIDAILPMLSARLMGVMAYRKIIMFSSQLESQNTELEIQRKEMAAQSNELIEQNEELEQQKKQLSEASRLKTVFLSNMSHELRTPLNSVISLSGVLNRRLEGKINEEEYSYIDVIERNGKHLLSLINDILDISRIESGKEEVKWSKFKFDSMVSDLIVMIKPEADKKGLKITSVLNGLPEIISDYEKCQHIIQNILGNAVKYTDSGSIDIGGKQIDNKIIITISDTGIGIAKENISGIFNEFQQADSSNSRRFEGTGLGLAIAKKYAEILGGNIKVTSELGKGTVFTITLPTKSISTNGESVNQGLINSLTTSISQDINPQEKTILLVEDSEPAMIQLKDILETTGYTILEAKDGVQALEVLKDNIPDAMILDLMMPEMDGFELLKTIRDKKETSKLPVVILSAKYITSEELSFLKYNQVRQLIQKGSIDRERLLQVVSEVVMVDADGIKKKAPKRLINKSSNGRPLVLVVEDNPDNMITIKAMLANRCETIEAGDGIQCIEMAKKHNPSLILMDINLPNLSGTDALIELRKDPNFENTPVIAITAGALKEDRDKILEVGFDGYISKPIDNAIFNSYLDKYI